MASQLPNYLISNRKRLLLQQTDVAFLLGVHLGQTVSRYESFNRIPSLSTALALEAIFQRPVRELFAGLYEAKAKEVAVRLKTMGHKVRLGDSAADEARKRRWVANLSAALNNQL